MPVSHFAAHCQRRLERISQTGPKKGLRKPNLDEIEQAKASIKFSLHLVWFLGLKFQILVCKDILGGIIFNSVLL